MTELVDEKVDKILAGRPEVLKKVKDNRSFINKIKTHRVKDAVARVRVYGYRDVNINAILKDNIWNRSIFTTDKLCRMHLGATLEQLKKYQKKKRHAPINFFFILLIILGIIAAVVIILILLPKFTGGVGSVV